MESHWESAHEHEVSGRPRRRYYKFTTDGAEAARHAMAESHAAGKAAEKLWNLRPRRPGIVGGAR